MYVNALQVRQRLLTVMVCAIVTGAGGMASAAPPRIVAATSAANTLTIYGTNLQHKDPAKHPVAVSLGTVPLITASVTANMIVATVPATMPPGSYLLVVDSGEGPGDEFWVTLGAVGPQGPVGPTGPQGGAGATGQQGSKGPTGASGPIGTTGAQGPAGVTGLAGLKGATGAQGPMGTIGPQGVAGPTGSNGLNGSTGSTGAQGPAGATGPQGAAGANAASGYQIKSTSATIPGGSGAAGTLFCDQGKVAVGGGWNIDASTDLFVSEVMRSAPTPDGSGWTGSMRNTNFATQTITLYAICINAPAGSGATLQTKAATNAGLQSFLRVIRP